MEKGSVEANCKHLEDELVAAAQQASEKDRAHATALTNMQIAKRDVQLALDSKIHFYIVGFFLSFFLCLLSEGFFFGFFCAC